MWVDERIYKQTTYLKTDRQKTHLKTDRQKHKDR